MIVFGNDRDFGGGKLSWDEVKTEDDLPLAGQCLPKGNTGRCR